MTFSADLIYDVLRKYDPDHVLLRAARAEAAAGLTDIRRLADLLVAVAGPDPACPARRGSRRSRSRSSPASARSSSAGEVLDESLDEAVAELVAEAMAD